MEDLVEPGGIGTSTGAVPPDETTVQVRWIQVGEGAAASQRVTDSETNGDLDPLDRIEQQQLEFPISLVEANDLIERGAVDEPIRRTRELLSVRLPVAA